MQSYLLVSHTGPDTCPKPAAGPENSAESM